METILIALLDVPARKNDSEAGKYGDWIWIGDEAFAQLIGDALYADSDLKLLLKQQGASIRWTPHKMKTPSQIRVIQERLAHRLQHGEAPMWKGLDEPSIEISEVCESTTGGTPFEALASVLIPYGSDCYYATHSIQKATQIAEKVAKPDLGQFATAVYGEQQLTSTPSPHSDIAAILSEIIAALQSPSQKAATQQPTPPNNGVPLADAEMQVERYIRDKVKSGVQLSSLTRDGISKALNIGAGTVSKTKAWKQLTAIKKSSHLPTSEDRNHHLKQASDITPVDEMLAAEEADQPERDDSPD